MQSLISSYATSASYIDDGYIDTYYYEPAKYPPSGDYFVDGYIDVGYYDLVPPVTNQNCSIFLIYLNLFTCTFSIGFKYSSDTLKYFQALEVSSSNFPFNTPSKLSQITFDAVFPCMTDIELYNVRTFIFETVALSDIFQMVFFKNDTYRNVRFANRKLKVNQIQSNVNEVTISFIFV